MSNTNSEAPEHHHLSKRITLYIVLAGIFLTSAITAEIIGVKLFSLEALFGMDPIEVGFIHGFNLPAGFLLWPIVFITTDIINEYYGKDGVRKISWVTAAMIAFVFLFLWITTELPFPGFWESSNSVLMDVKGQNALGPDVTAEELSQIGDFIKDSTGKKILDSDGNTVAHLTPENTYFIGSKNYNTNSIFLQGIGIIIGSLIAFLIGQLLDASLFQWFKKKTGDKMIWLRATGSTFISQCFDSYIVLFIAFYIVPYLVHGKPSYPIVSVLAFSTVGYIYKVGISVVLTPLIYLAHYIIDEFLGEKLAHKMMKEADKMD